MYLALLHFYLLSPCIEKNQKMIKDEKIKYAKKQKPFTYFSIDVVRMF
jgi:hypothetical protein